MTRRFGGFEGLRETARAESSDEAAAVEKGSTSRRRKASSKSSAGRRGAAHRAARTGDGRPDSYVAAGWGKKNLMVAPEQAEDLRRLLFVKKRRDKADWDESWLVHEALKRFLAEHEGDLAPLRELGL